jgi:hypothetical protein
MDQDRPYLAVRLSTILELCHTFVVFVLVPSTFRGFLAVCETFQD